jgi:hypothetical protein
VKATRRSQPFKRGAAARAVAPAGPGSVLGAMIRGATAGGVNPADQRRAMQKRGSALGAALRRRAR